MESDDNSWDHIDKSSITVRQSPGRRSEGSDSLLALATSIPPPDPPSQELDYFTNPSVRASPPFHSLSPTFAEHANRFSSTMNESSENNNNNYDENELLETMKRSTEDDPEEQTPQEVFKDDIMAINRRLQEISDNIKKENRKTIKHLTTKTTAEIKGATEVLKLEMESYVDEQIEIAMDTIDQKIQTAINSNIQSLIDSKIQNHPMLNQIRTMTDFENLIDTRIKHTTPPVTSPTAITSSSSSTIKTPFKLLKKKSDYKIWRLDLANNCSVYPTFSSLVELNNNNNYILKSTLPKLDNTRLYNALTQAVTDDLLKPIITTDPTIQTQADGLRLLEQMEQDYNKIETDYLTIGRLVNNIQTIVKHNTESNLNYLARFTRTVSALKDTVSPHDTRIPTPNMLAYYLILGLRRPNDFRQTLIDLQQDTASGKTFYKTGDLKFTMKKVEAHLNTLNIIATSSGEQSSYLTAATSSNQTPSTTLSPPSTRNNGNRTSAQGGGNRSNQNNNNNNNNTNNNNNNNTTPQRTRTAQQSEFYLAVKNNPGTIRNIVIQFNNKNKNKCYLHPDSEDSHKFHECGFVRFLLSQKQCLECLDAVKPREQQPQQPQGGTPTARRVNMTPDQYTRYQSFIRNDTDTRSVQSDNISAISSEFDESQYNSDSDNSNTTSTYLVSHNNTVVSSCSHTTSPLPSILKLPTNTTSTKNPSTPSSSPSVTFSSTPSPSYTSTTFKRKKKILCTAKFIPSSSTHLIGKSVPDSGSSHHLFYNPEYFEYIVPLDSTKDNALVAVMGDDSTALAIKGYGMINILLEGHRVRHMAYFVPALQTNLISIKEHMKYQGNFFFCADNTAVLAFPSKILHVNNKSELTLSTLPAKTSTSSYIFDQDSATLSCTSSYKKYSIIPTNFVDSPTKAQQNKMTRTVRVRRVISSGHIPNTTKSPSGFHIKSTHRVTIRPSHKKQIHTGISCIIPANTQLIVNLVDSLKKRNITSLTPSFTSSNTGELIIELQNESYNAIKIRENSTIAELQFQCDTIPYSISQPTSSSTSTTSPSKPKLTVFRLTKDRALLINSKTLKSKRVHIPPSEFFSEDKFDEATIKVTTINDHEESPINPFLQMMTEKVPDSVKQKVEQLNKPSITPNEKVPSSSPQTSYLTRDQLLQSIGFLKPDSFIRHFNNLAKATVQIQPFPKRDDILPAEVASMNAPKQNKTPSPPPSNFGELMHSDIGFGPVTAIGGIKYCITFVDKATRKVYCYPLKGLKEQHLVKAHTKLINDMGFAPKLIRTDFDSKLFQGKLETFLNSKGTRIETAPPRRQDKNGLVERTWQTLVRMARNWLVASQLPSRYWWFAIKRACEIKNILPTKHLPNRITTPHELVHNEKVDYRQLFPMFSTAYIRYAREDGEEKNKWQNKTLKTILVGTSSTSDGLLFYHPPSKQILTCGDGYKIDSFSPAGPQFEEKYDGGFIFNTKGDEHHYHRPPSHELSSTKFIKRDNNYIPVNIINQPINEEKDLYIVQEVDSGDIIQIESENIHDSDPTTDPATHTNTTPFPHHPWIKHQAKATLFINDKMDKPKQGKLLLNNNEWVFQVGRTDKGGTIPLHNFQQLAESLIHNRKLFQGWKRLSTVLTARYLRATSNLICRHVKLNPHISAKDLEVLKSPTLLQHHKLSKNDREVWDKAYDAEYHGLVGIDTWEMITEEEYGRLRSTVGNAMPTMAISTIKYDENGHPKRAKYRIVALGNLDPYPWTKSDCFAPVLSQPELRLLVSLAAKLKVIPKNADVSQAFCQSYLPENEPYVLKPPPGCPRTPKGMYWKLKKTLYGLKRSPRHWYELARKTLLDLGLKQNPHTPCIFVGRIDKSLPPIYIGLYVDDIIYFSESPETEKLFEQKFEEKLPCSWNDQIDHFLGIKFTCQKHDDGEVSIYLNQPAFIENLLEKHELHGEAVNTCSTPFRSGHVIDTIPRKTYDEEKQRRLTLKMQELVGSLNWLAISTRPDLSTVVNLLARYMGKPSSGHLEAAKRVLRYLKSTPDLGISFHSRRNEQLEAFLKFPIAPNIITSFSDANWGPQDASVPKPNSPTVNLELFKSRSLSGFLIWHTGPIHWVSKRQSITARSSAESEIYATDECCKSLQNLANIIDGMGLKDNIMKSPTIIYNDNSACVCWSRNLTTKGLRHIQIRENAIREQIQQGLITVEHIAGKINLSDFFTKEEKSVEHFLNCRSQIMEAPPHLVNLSHQSNTSQNCEQMNNSHSNSQEPGGY